MSEDNKDLKKSLEYIAICSEAIDKLSESLKGYMETYNGIKSILESYRDISEESTSDLKVFLPELNQHIQQFQDSQTSFTDLMSSATPVFEKAVLLVDESQKKLEMAAMQLGKHNSDIQGIRDTLSNIESFLSDNSDIGKTSQRIQRALGLLGDTESLETISKKLDLEIEQIQQEKQEIIEPLKNAAAFQEVVKSENEKLSSELSMKITDLEEKTRETIEKNLEPITSDDQDSMASKIDNLTSIAFSMQDKLEEIISNQGKSTGLTGIFGRREKPMPKSETKDKVASLKELCVNSIPVLVKTNWTGDFAFAVDYIDEEKAYGHTYKDGKPYKSASYRLDEDNWLIYTQSSLEAIREYELNIKYKRNSTQN